MRTVLKKTPCVELIAEVAPQRAKEARPFRLAVIQLGAYDGTIYDAAGWWIDLVICVTTFCFDSAWVGSGRILLR
ncbi:hypothetical protein ACLK1T_03420 [Escherichia coli]